MSKNKKPSDLEFQTVKQKKASRPTFRTKSGLPIRAAGLLAFCRDPETQEAYFLMSNYTGDKLEDLGGKTDKVDNDPVESAAREAAEETNAAFRLSGTAMTIPSPSGGSVHLTPEAQALKEASDQQPVMSQTEFESVLPEAIRFWKGILCSNRQRVFYISHSRYLLFVVELHPEWMTLRPSTFFGIGEICESSPRDIIWLSADQLWQKIESKNINSRLNYYPLHKVISKLANDWKADITLNIDRTATSKSTSASSSQEQDETAVDDEEDSSSPLSP